MREVQCSYCLSNGAIDVAQMHDDDDNNKGTETVVLEILVPRHVCRWFVFVN